MDRRNFFKIVSAVSAGVASSACDSKRDALIPLLVPDHEMAPGEESWHPAVCSECAAGCGAIARVMEGERVIERNGGHKGEKFRQRIACVKKLEGNPLDPVSGGRLCARGQAAVQSLYNPDRVAGPMRRTSNRGDARFTPISWDESIATAADRLAKVRASDPAKILFLSRPQTDSRSVAVQQFLQAIGAPPAMTCTPADFATDRKAAATVFGWNGLPRYDLANARFALGVGADFLGGWTSPVYYGRQFGHFRQGRAGVRGKLVQAESRMSLTAASADEWLPLRPGSEPQFLMAIGRILLDEKLARNEKQIPEGVRAALLAANLDDAIRATGLSEKRVRRVARELAESDAPLVIAGASVVQTNSLDALIAAHFVNVLMECVGRPGGMFRPYSSPVAGPTNGNVPEAVARAQLLLLDGANPVYTLPSATAISEKLAHLDTIVSFGMFIDDSAAYADMILPSHHPLESEMAVVPAVPAAAVSVNIAMPFVQPLHDTRPLAQILEAIGRKMNVKFQATGAASFVQSLLTPTEKWEDLARQGGLWRDEQGTSSISAVAEKIEWRNPVFVGASEQFPLHFQPYLSLQYCDGSGANLPWMQEMPDPSSSAMWDLPIEIDPQTAAQLRIATGDWVRVESPHGSLEATAYVHPAAVPGVVSMAIGEGHTHYGRYASRRGANPLSIVAPVWAADSAGALAFGATRVRLARLERAPSLIQFSPNDREQGPWGYR
jgi:anaerobic selenocysteine-containing dehydrogenase